MDVLIRLRTEHRYTVSTRSFTSTHLRWRSGTPGACRRSRVESPAWSRTPTPFSPSHWGWHRGGRSSAEPSPPGPAAAEQEPVNGGSGEHRRTQDMAAAHRPWRPSGRSSPGTSRCQSEGTAGPCSHRLGELPSGTGNTTHHSVFISCLLFRRLQKLWFFLLFVMSPPAVLSRNHSHLFIQGRSTEAAQSFYIRDLDYNPILVFWLISNQYLISVRDWDRPSWVILCICFSIQPNNLVSIFYFFLQ